MLPIHQRGEEERGGRKPQCVEKAVCLDDLIEDENNKPTPHENGAQKNNVRLPTACLQGPHKPALQIGSALEDDTALPLNMTLPSGPPALTEDSKDVSLDDIIAAKPEYQCHEQAVLGEVLEESADEVNAAEDAHAAGGGHASCDVNRLAPHMDALFEIQQGLSRLMPRLLVHLPRKQNRPPKSLVEMCIRSVYPSLEYLCVAIEAVTPDSVGPAATMEHEIRRQLSQDSEVSSVKKSREHSLAFDIVFSTPFEKIPGNDTCKTSTEPQRVSLQSSRSNLAAADDIVAPGDTAAWTDGEANAYACKKLANKPRTHRPLKQGANGELLSSDNECYIHPERPFRLGWDFCSLVLILIVSVVTPFELAFFWDADVAPLGFRLVDYAIDSFFWCDIVLNFFTACHEGHGVSGHLVTDFKGIASHYARTWLYLDVLASFPITEVVDKIGSSRGAADSSKAGTMLKVLKYAKIARVMKVLRVLKLGGLMQIVEEKMVAIQSMTVVFQLGKMSVVMVILSHNVACIWYLVGYMSTELYGDSWLTEAGLDDHSSSLERYIASIYFAITTGTTVGYGDIHPVNTVEQAVTSVILILSVGYIGQFLGKVCQIVNSLRQNENEMSQAKRNALLFMSQREVERELQFKVLRYIEHTYETHAETSLDSRIMSQLSESLQAELALAITGHVFSQFPLFKSVDQTFLTALCEVGQTKRAGVGDLVVAEDQSAHEMFWVVRGEAAVIRRGLRINTLHRNDWFGELALFFPRVVRVATVRCETHCEFLVLHHDAFHAQMKEFPHVKEEFDALRKELKVGNTSGLKLNCGRCGSPDHLTRDCVLHGRPCPASEGPGIDDGDEAKTKNVCSL